MENVDYSDQEKIQLNLAYFKAELLFLALALGIFGFNVIHLSKITFAQTWQKISNTQVNFLLSAAIIAATIMTYYFWKKSTFLSTIANRTKTNFYIVTWGMVVLGIYGYYYASFFSAHSGIIVKSLQSSLHVFGYIVLIGVVIDFSVNTLGYLTSVCENKTRNKIVMRNYACSVFITAFCVSIIMNPRAHGSNNLVFGVEFSVIAIVLLGFLVTKLVEWSLRVPSLLYQKASPVHSSLFT